MKRLEEWTPEELKAQLKLELVISLFAGELNTFIHKSIDWSIRWWQAEEERRNKKAKYYIPDGARIDESDLSVRAITVLTAEGFIRAKDVREYISEHQPRARATIRKFVNCGPLTTTEIMDYYLYKV